MRAPAYLLICLFLVWCDLAHSAKVETGDPALDAAFTQITDNNYATKESGIAALAKSTHPRSQDFLSGILDGSLRYHRKSKKLVWVTTSSGNKVTLRDALNDTPLGTESARKVRKFPLNNSLRSSIQAMLATFDLQDPDPAVRLAAVERMIAKPSPVTAGLLARRLADESAPEVRGAMEVAVALGDLGNQDSQRRLAAVKALEGRLEPMVRSGLNRMAAADPDDAVRTAANAALVEIQKQVDLYGAVETLFFGLSLGSVLVLAAIGLAITFGVMGVINMAHGELMMLGAYTTYLIQQALPEYIGISVLLAIPAAFLVSGIAGIVIERGVIRFLYGRPLETLLATFGISLILQQLARTLISPQNVPVSNPEWMSGFWQVNSVLNLTYNRLFILLFCLIVFAGLFFVLKRTTLGLQVRAVSQNRAMARAMGIRSDRVDALTFGLGSGIAGMAGVALSQLTNVGPNLGQSYIVDSFMVVVFGGVGNLWGTLLGGLGLGIANKALEPWSGAVLAKILVLVFIILFIQKRPRGLFPQKGRAAEN